MERPAKRPRPDGFEKPKITYKPPETINTFASASKVTGFPSKPIPNDSKKSVVKTGHVTQLPQNQFVGCVVTKESKPRLPNRPLKPVSLGHHRPPVTENSETERSIALKHKPPVLAQVEAKPPEKASTSILSMQPVIMPPSTSPEKPISIRKPPLMPVPFPKRSMTPLKPLALALPVPQEPAPPQKTMKTILTTSVAQAIDPTKEGTGAELLALFLQQHEHDFTSSIDQELYRGIMLSPDKRSRGKHPKFIRGGLAERVQQHISCKQTDFMLWKRQVEQKVESGMKITSDMQLHILRILHVLKTPEKPHSVPLTRCASAICRLTDRHKFIAGELATGTYLVLFNFPPTHGSGSVISSPQQFGEGRNVSVWMPWQTIDVSDARDAEIQRVLSQYDDLTSPHILLVVSRFYVSAPKQPD